MQLAFTWSTGKIFSINCNHRLIGTYRKNALNLLCQKIANQIAIHINVCIINTESRIECFTKVLPDSINIFSCKTWKERTYQQWMEFLYFDVYKCFWIWRLYLLSVPVILISAATCLAILQLSVLYFPAKIHLHNTGYFSHTSPKQAYSWGWICTCLVWKIEQIPLCTKVSVQLWYVKAQNVCHLKVSNVCKPKIILYHISELFSEHWKFH